MVSNFIKHLKICVRCDYSQLEDDCVKCLAGERSYPETCPKSYW